MCIADRVKINTEHLALAFSCLLLAIDLINMGCVDILNTPHIMRIFDVENLVSCPLTEQLFPITGGKNGARGNGTQQSISRDPGILPRPILGMTSQAVYEMLSALYIVAPILEI